MLMGPPIPVTRGVLAGELAEVLSLRDWLTAQRVTVVGMESTGIYWNARRAPPRRCVAERSGMTAAGLWQQAGDAEGSPIREVPGRVGAALTTPGRNCQTARVRQARRERVRVQEPVWSPLKARTGSNLADYGPGSSARPPAGRRLRRHSTGVGAEAAPKACGVGAARLQGKAGRLPRRSEHAEHGNRLGTALPADQPGRQEASRPTVGCHSRNARYQV